MPQRQYELERLRALRAQVDRTMRLIEANVDDARRKGCTWEQIGDALGISKQAAQQRFSVKEP